MKNLFAIAPSEGIRKETIEEFCSLKIKETNRVEYKSRFPGDLAKSIASFANTFGGIILLGVEANDENEPILPLCGMPFEKGLEERVLQICNRAIYQPVWPTTWVAKFEDDSQSPKERAVVVIRIEESDATPHAVGSKDEVPLRTGSVTERIRRATVEEIEELLTRRKLAVQHRGKAINRFRERIDFFTKDFSLEYERRVGGYDRKKMVLDFIQSSPTLEVISMPLFPPGSLATLAELRSLIDKCFPYRVEQHSASTLLRGSWRSAQEGFLHYSGGVYFQLAEANTRGLFGYCEGNIPDAQSLDAWTRNTTSRLDRSMSIDSMVMRSAILAVLLFLPKFYQQLGFWGTIEISVRMSRTQGYSLSDLTARASPVCPDTEISWTTQMTVSALAENVDTVCCEAVNHVHSAFGWESDFTQHLKKEIDKAKAVIPYWSRGSKGNR